jgi:NAD(P)-dependent dehydrogenase (short-subunit alcohol dehydrogenase family)
MLYFAQIMRRAGLEMIQDFSLAGRVALVTGGASGIGNGIAQVLGAAGAVVVIADIDGAKAEAAAEALRAAGFQAGHVQLDVAVEDSVVRGCAEVTGRYGVPWVLVNNAGLQDRQMLLDGTVAEWERVMAVNARGPFLTSREFGRAMVQAGKGGRIVNIASMALQGALTQGHAIYASSKAALLGLTRASALELLGHAITVNTVLPGGVATPGAMAAQGPAPEGPGRRMPPLGMCAPQDIGAAVLFFATPAAKMLTNQTLAVDAGWSLS